MVLFIGLAEKAFLFIIEASKPLVKPRSSVFGFNGDERNEPVD